VSTYFGGKSKIADAVWERLGDVTNYVEPFFGSGAVLLGRPESHTGHIETVNDKDGFVSNFWRAVQKAPEETASYADWPVNENDLHARHAWLVGQKDSLMAKLEGDPDYFDAKIAGWWVWGMSCWIGSGFCSGKGPWVVDENHELVRLGKCEGVKRARVHLKGDQGVNRKLIHLKGKQGVNRKRVHLRSAGGGVGVHRPRVDLQEWFERLSGRLRYVRVCSGDWTRILGPSPTTQLGLTGVFLDPPYSQSERDSSLYGVEDSVSVAVRDWAVGHGNDKLFRIALCGYEGEHEMPPDWEVYSWKPNGGYGLQGEGRGRENKGRERIWFSPYCLKHEQGNLFEANTTAEGI